MPRRKYDCGGKGLATRDYGIVFEDEVVRLIAFLLILNRTGDDVLQEH